MARQERFPKHGAGYSLPELLVVIAIIGIAVLILFPLVGEQLRQAEIRTAADQLAMDCKAVRMIAISKRLASSLTVEEAPLNRYAYTDARGKLRTIQMPGGVVIEASDSPVTFLPNGSVTGGATTVLVVTLSSDASERWTITTSPIGVTTTIRQRVAS